MEETLNLTQIAKHCKTFDQYQRKRELLTEINRLNRIHSAAHMPNKFKEVTHQPNGTCEKLSKFSDLPQTIPRR